MQIQANKIVYANHSVICDPDVYSSEYMEDMASHLSPLGNARIHEEELEDMNNDGSWTVEDNC